MYWFFLDLKINQSWMLNRYRNVALIHRPNAAEACLLNELISSSRHVRFSGSDTPTELMLAIADSSAQAQALAKSYGFWISEPGQGARDIGALSIHSLLSLEGLRPFESPRSIDSMSAFFSVLGFTTLSDLSTLTREAFVERWGELGIRIYNELASAESGDDQNKGNRTVRSEAISPYRAETPIETQVVLDFPISIVSLLLHSIEESLHSLFLRLQGRRMNARRVDFQLRLEYSNEEYVFAIEPSSPSRDIRFYMSLIERKLDAVSLLNPVRDIAIQILTTPDHEVQDSFQDASASDQTKLNLLTSLLKQEQIECGFAHIRNELVPELTWSIESLPQGSRYTDHIKPQSSECHPKQQLLKGARSDSAPEETSAEGWKAMANYSSQLLRAPRPSIIFEEPELLTPLQFKRRRFLTERPVEKIETNWWTSESHVTESLASESLEVDARACESFARENLARGSLASQSLKNDKRVSEVRRAYYFTERSSSAGSAGFVGTVGTVGPVASVASSAENRSREWVYEDLIAGDFFLHGVFD